MILFKKYSVRNRFCSGLFIIVAFSMGSLWSYSSESANKGFSSKPNSEKEDRNRAFILLEVTPLLGPVNSVFRLMDTGTLERWDGSNLTVFRKGTMVLPSGEVERIFGLADTVPGIRDLGNGVQEGDIYFLRKGKNGETSVFLESIAPQSLQKLVTDVTVLSKTMEMADNRSYFLRAIPLSQSRAAKLISSRYPTLRPEQCDEDLQDTIQTAGKRPHEFIEISISDFARIMDDVKSREFLFAPHNLPPVQSQLWTPPQ